MESVYFGIITCLVLVILGLIFWLNRLSLQVRRAENQMRNQEVEAREANRELEQESVSVLRLTQSLSNLNDEAEIIDTLLSLVMETTKGVGVSFVPLDENNKPITVTRQGDSPVPFPDAWLEYLASPTVRQGCANCSSFHVEASNDSMCALLRGPFSEGLGLYCFPLRQLDHEIGMMNLYMPGKNRLDDRKYRNLQSLAQVTSMAIWGERLRERELTTVRQLQNVREKQDSKLVIQDVLNSAKMDFDVEYVLFLHDSETHIPWVEQFEEGALLCAGSISNEVLIEIEGQYRLEIVKGRNQDRTPHNHHIDNVFSWIHVPVKVQEFATHGALILVNKQTEDVDWGHQVNLQLLSNQIALIISNDFQKAEMEYRIIMEERQRLSREIHDGLAQTLGFLKLQLAQMMTSLDRNDMNRLHQLMKTSYSALSEAYQDTRKAIDGLRISPLGKDGYQLATWLNQTIEDYKAQSFTITVEALDVKGGLPPEVHAQLIRIVQEALSNVRKHAQVNQAFITCIQKDQDLVLEIKDQGMGFSPGDVPGPSRYGLQVMRERADLMGADFQVISKPGEGTIVRVRLPLDAKIG